MKQVIVVWHSSYGCDTGCCGHRIAKMDAVDAAMDVHFDGTFRFSHPNGDDPLQWAKEMVMDEFGAEHVADLDWEHCMVVDDC